MRRQHFLSPVFCLMLTTAVSAQERFTIDPAHTLPTFEVNHLGFSTQRGRFDRTHGKIDLDRTQKRGRVELVIEAGSINMGSSKWDEHMKSADFFDVSRYPEIRFESEAFQFEGDRPVSAEGKLTLLGVSRPVKVSIRHFSCGTNTIVDKPVCAADIETTLKRSEFGMTRYLPAVGDQIRILSPVEAFRD